MKSEPLPGVAMALDIDEIVEPGESDVRLETRVEKSAIRRSHAEVTSIFWESESAAVG